MRERWATGTKKPKTINDQNRNNKLHSWNTHPSKWCGDRVERSRVLFCVALRYFVWIWSIIKWFVVGVWPVSWLFPYGCAVDLINWKSFIMNEPMEWTWRRCQLELLPPFFCWPLHSIEKQRISIGILVALRVMYCVLIRANRPCSARILNDHTWIAIFIHFTMRNV